MEIHQGKISIDSLAQIAPGLRKHLKKYYDDLFLRHIFGNLPNGSSVVVSVGNTPINPQLEVYSGRSRVGLLSIVYEQIDGDVVAIDFDFYGGRKVIREDRNKMLRWSESGRKDHNSDYNFP